MVEGAEVFRDVSILEIRGAIPPEVMGIQCDSRRVKTGDLFVALQGTTFDGHRFISEAESRKACAVVVEEWTDTLLPQIRVQDTLAVLPKIAANFHHHPAKRLKKIGVTGSNGKTTSTYILESIWKAWRQACAVIGTIEYRFGGNRIEAPNTTPLAHELQSILRQIVDAGIPWLVMEVSSHALALHRVDELEFEAGLFTNLSEEHLDFHKTPEEYCETKKRLFTQYLKPDGAAILNIDDEVGSRFAKELSGKRIVTYGMQSSAEVSAKSLRMDLKGSEFTTVLPNGDIRIQTPLLGRHNIYNLLGACATAYACGIPLEVIQRGMEQFASVPGRLESVPNGIGAQVVVDYCHTPDAVLKCLETLSALPHQRLITIIGCGGDRDRTKRPRMGEIALRWSDQVIVTSDNPRTEDPGAIIREIEAGMASGRDRYQVIPDRKAAICEGIRRLQTGDILLIAGKGHETYQIIGREKFPFDDRVIARAYLAEMGKCG